MGDPYRVKDLAVDKIAATPTDAIAQGRAEARVVGAQRLIDRLTLEQDRNAARQPLVATDVARLYFNFQTQAQDKTFSVTGGTRATGLLTWIFDGKAVREYLDTHGVPFVDTQAAKALIVPVASQGVDPNAWKMAWSQVLSPGTTAGQTAQPKSDDTVLTPYAASAEVWTRRPGWSDVQQEISSTQSDHAIIAEAYSTNGQYYVRLVDLRTGVAEANIGVAGPFADLPSAQAGAIAELERVWKTQSIVRTSGSSSVKLIATFANIGEWIKIRKGVEASRLISNLNIESISAAGADLSFVYNGRPDQLQSDLRSRGVDLRGDGNGWVLQAVSAQ